MLNVLEAFEATVLGKYVPNVIRFSKEIFLTKMILHLIKPKGNS